MATFSGVEKDLITDEGTTLSNISDDYGGISKYGISSQEYPDVDIKNLTLQQAMDIYEHDYWDTYQLSKINCQQIANKLFVALINMNPREAISCIQTAVNWCKNPATTDIAVDGDIGQKTIDAINDAREVGWLHDRFAIELILLYISKVEADKSQINFLVSWDRRAVGD